MTPVPHDAIQLDLVKHLKSKGIDERTVDTFMMLTLQTWLVAVIDREGGEVTIPEPSHETTIANDRMVGTLRNDDGTITLVTTETSAEQKASTGLRMQAREVDREIVGRNQPCPCGSGKKYKRCCGA